MSYPMRRFVFSCFFVCLCHVSAVLADASVMSEILSQTPFPDEFSFCWGGTCAAVETIGLTNEEWAKVHEVFNPMPENAAEERFRMMLAIGLLESLVGPKTGTAGDRAGTYGNSAWPGQLDCNDEATNTTSYIRMMAAEGLIRFHEIQDTAVRGFLFFARHSTAVIRERDSGVKYAVDSWFYDNGKPPVILPLPEWLNGWRPPHSTAP